MQEMKSGIVKFIAILAIGVMNSGCAPRFIDVEQPVPHVTWVERQVETVGNAVGPSQGREFVLSTKESNVLGPDERVRWVAGVDLSKSKLQRSSERLAGGPIDGLFGQASKNTSSLVEVHQFNVVGDALSIEGQLSLQRFNGGNANRYYVEFLNSGRMSESSETEMTSAWRSLSAKLKERGLNTANVVLGGSKYEQRTNAIVMVRIGK
ncbi:hypothetical protein [Acidovorax delafieldii]|uniref:hypothetical protein n=1 Tax=Acidovorax delafieldii TaxID=47920 RepID=UPI003ECDFD82